MGLTCSASSMGPQQKGIIMAPQPWVDRMPMKINRKVVEMGWACSASSMGPPQKGFLMAPQLWVNKRVDRN